MPKKVKKKAKKSKAKKEKKDDDDEEKPTFEVPEYKDPDVYTPKAELDIRFANHVFAKLGKFQNNRFSNLLIRFCRLQNKGNGDNEGGRN